MLYDSLFFLEIEFNRMMSKLPPPDLLFQRSLIFHGTFCLEKTIVCASFLHAVLSPVHKKRYAFSNAATNWWYFQIGQTSSHSTGTLRGVYLIIFRNVARPHSIVLNCKNS